MPTGDYGDIDAANGHNHTMTIEEELGLDTADGHNEVVGADGNSVDVADLDLDLDDDDDDDDENLPFYNENLTREALQDRMDDLKMNSTAELDPSTLLLRYYRYWSLDDLSSALANLLTEVDHDLVELVNSHYLNFISLGKSMDGSQDLTSDIKIDVASYLKQLQKDNDDIHNDLSATTRLVLFNRQLTVYKRCVETILLLKEQIDTFTAMCTRLGEGETETVDANTQKTPLDDEDLRHLVALYFSINKQYAVLLKLVRNRAEVQSKDLLNNSQIVHALSKQMNALKLEFEGLLANHVDALRAIDDEASRERIFQVVRLRKVLDHHQEQELVQEQLEKQEREQRDQQEQLEKPQQV